MKSMRFCLPLVAALFAAMFAPPLKADEISVFFSGMITDTDGAPGLSVGESFTGGFSYATDDTFEISIGGQSSYSLTSPEDKAFVTVGTLNVSIDPLTGVNAIVAPAVGLFSIQDFFNPGISITFEGNTSFLPSQALPDPLNIADITSGNIGFQFSENSVDYIVNGTITQVATTPEPRGLALIFALAGFMGLPLRRKFTASRS